MWKELITQLEAEGVSQREIGEYVGLTQGAVSQLKLVDGREPSYHVGVKLIELHRQKLGGEQKVA